MLLIQDPPKMKPVKFHRGPTPTEEVLAVYAHMVDPFFAF